MKQVMRTGVGLGVLVLRASLGLAQQDFSGVEVSATPVNGAVHMLRANPAAGGPHSAAMGLLRPRSGSWQEAYQPLTGKGGA